MKQEIYTLRNITREFSFGQERVQAIREVNLSVGMGEFVAIRGRSGAGKSTLLGVLGLMDKPTSGTMEFCGHQICAMNGREIDAVRRQNIGFLFQQDLLIPHLTIFENLALPLRYNGSMGTLSDRIADSLNSVGLGGKAGRRPQQLSGGERTRVALARAMIAGPQVLLADEPTGALDSDTAASILRLLSELHQSGTTIIVVTHDPEVAVIATREVVIKDGRAHG